MIQVQDNFLPENIFNYQRQMLVDSDFERIEVGEKDFHIVRPDMDFLNYILEKLTTIFSKDIELVLSFFRLATDKIDTDWRIHSDLNINGRKPTHAGVLYFSEHRNNVLELDLGAIPQKHPKEVMAIYDDLKGISPFDSTEQKPTFDLFGTAFWKHKKHGYRLSSETTNEEYNRLIEIDSNDLSKWELDSVVSTKENRLLIYEANMFHSKYPNVAWSDENGKGRMVLVLFFNVKK